MVASVCLAACEALLGVRNVCGVAKEKYDPFLSDLLNRNELNTCLCSPAEEKVTQQKRSECHGRRNEAGQILYMGIFA